MFISPSSTRNTIATELQSHIQQNMGRKPKIWIDYFLEYIELRCHQNAFQRYKMCKNSRFWRRGGQAPLRPPIKSFSSRGARKKGHFFRVKTKSSIWGFKYGLFKQIIKICLLIVIKVFPNREDLIVFLLIIIIIFLFSSTINGKVLGPIFLKLSIRVWPYQE